MYKYDYELAVVQAVKQVFPNITVEDCYYHYCNAAVSKKSNELNLKESEVGRKVTPFCTFMPLLPLKLIPKAFFTFIEMSSQDVNLSIFKFLD